MSANLNRLYHNTTTSRIANYRRVLTLYEHVSCLRCTRSPARPGHTHSAKSWEKVSKRLLGSHPNARRPLCDATLQAAFQSGLHCRELRVGLQQGRATASVRNSVTLHAVRDTHAQTHTRSPSFASRAAHTT